MRAEERTETLGKVSKGYLGTKAPNTISYSIVCINSPKLCSHIFKSTYSSLTESVIKKKAASPLPHEQSCLFGPQQINCCVRNQSELARFSLEYLAASNCSALGANTGTNWDL